MTRGRARRYLLVKQGYYPQVVADAGYTVFDWSTLNAGTLFQDSAKTTPIASNSDPVGAWVDGVSSVDFFQATTANKPTYTTASLNGLPTLSFDGSDFLDAGNINITTFAIWAVFRNSTTNWIWEHGDLLNNGVALNGTTTPTRINSGGVSATITADNSVLSGNIWNVSRLEYNNSYDSYQLYIDDSVLTKTGGINADPTYNVTANFTIGHRNNSSFYMTGNIAHLCIVSPYPTPAIIANMESYINSKWSVY